MTKQQATEAVSNLHISSKAKKALWDMFLALDNSVLESFAGAWDDEIGGKQVVGVQWEDPGCQARTEFYSV